jgi:hypothetical protein
MGRWVKGVAGTIIASLAAWFLTRPGGVFNPTAQPPTPAISTEQRQAVPVPTPASTSPENEKPPPITENRIR